MPQPVLAVSYFFHLVATVIWVGGLASLMVLVLPAARRTLAEDRQASAFYTRVRRGFFPLVNLSLVILLFTGFAQMAADEHYDGMLQFTNDWSVAMLLKHIAFAGMTVCGVLMQIVVAPALERAVLLTDKGKGDPAELARLRTRENRLAWLTLILGVLVLAFTAWATAV
ncbi:MAG: CopD family protein [Pleurocapsa minor GSE-CHR-MK-17-07R]|nr:CopD family protein [Pleurocapsa minor GSE-CHR-MK 17-07R]